MGASNSTPTYPPPPPPSKSSVNFKINDLNTQLTAAQRKLGVDTQGKLLAATRMKTDLTRAGSDYNLVVNDQKLYNNDVGLLNNDITSYNTDKLDLNKYITNVAADNNNIAQINDDIDYNKQVLAAIEAAGSNGITQIPREHTRLIPKVPIIDSSTRRTLETIPAVPNMSFTDGFQNMTPSPIHKFLATVSNQSLCNWFFYMYLLAIFSALFQFAFIIYSAFTAKNKVIGFSVAIVSGIALSIAVIQSLFLYSMCDRSLVDGR